MRNLFFALLLSSAHLLSNEGHVINFPSVPMYELVKFVSRLAEVNFIADQKLLDFEVSFICGKASSREELLGALMELLKQHDLEVHEEWGHYIVKKKAAAQQDVTPEIKDVSLPSPQLKKEGKFYVYKLQYHQGTEILDAIKQISSDDEEMGQSIRSMQLIKSTNSLFFSGGERSLEKLCKLIKSLDTALKQVFIEVLVIETNITNSLDFGLEWSANSKYKNKVGFGSGNFAHSDASPTFLESMQNRDGTMPSALGFNLGIIGDIIFHKGASFLSLGTLVSALQREGNCSILLNQKIIAQENKSSRIFVGDNVPFAGSVVQTIGNGQQTTANIEYRDVGVSLNITPLLGESDIITLDISEEITEAIDHVVHKTNQLTGIKTSKTNMATSVHVPDGHFLILSGMSKNVQAHHKSGPPCLGGIPQIGELLGKKEKRSEKSNLLIFVKPYIINSTVDYENLSRFEGGENFATNGF